MTPRALAGGPPRRAAVAAEADSRTPRTGTQGPQPAGRVHLSDPTGPGGAMLSWKGPQCGGERMNTLVVYDSKFGNTERVAQAMAERLQRPKVPGDRARWSCFRRRPEPRR